MHYHAEIWVSGVWDDLESQVKIIMAPFYEDLDMEFKVMVKKHQIMNKAAEIRVKNPGGYDDLPDEEVINRWSGYINLDGDLGYWHNPKGFWDWWQIGGRWKGIHIPDYDPNEDPDHEEVCNLCGGTGDRPEWVIYHAWWTEDDNISALAHDKTTAVAVAGILRSESDPDALSFKGEIRVERTFKDKLAEECNGCNGCHGKGIKTSWPTQWGHHDKDVIALSDIDDDFGCYTLIVDEVYHIKEWNGGTLVETGFDGKVKPFLAEMGITDGYLITVDYHC